MSSDAIPTTLTIVFQVHNEDKQIEGAIKAAQQLTAQILVMDMQSTDTTAKLAHKAGAKVVNIPWHPYVEPVRHLAFTKTNSDWILLLDADERLTSELAAEIRQLLAHPTTATHYRIPRRNLFAGRYWLKHGGWWPDAQTRLIKRSAFVEWPTAIHSTVKVDGPLGHLQSPFDHHFHGNLTEMVNKTIKFEDQEATLLFKAGRSVQIATFFRKFLAELYRRLFSKGGWQDGIFGWIESIYQAYSKTITWLLVYEKQQK